MAGWVATVSATTSTSEQIAQDIIDDYVGNVAEYYGVDESDVSVATVYEASGTMSVTIPDDVNEEELVDAIANSIAERKHSFVTVSLTNYLLPICLFFMDFFRKYYLL